MEIDNLIRSEMQKPKVTICRFIITCSVICMITIVTRQKKNQVHGVQKFSTKKFDLFMWYFTFIHELNHNTIMALRNENLLVFNLWWGGGFLTYKNLGIDCPPLLSSQNDVSWYLQQWDCHNFYNCKLSNYTLSKK